MAQAAKYLFDRNFESLVASNEPPEVLRERELRAKFDGELEAARLEEYQRGLAEGEKKARASFEAGSEKAAVQIAGSAKSILGRIEKECGAMRAEAVRVAVAAADCLASELIRREPTAMLESLFADCLEHLADAPHVAVRVNDAYAERLQERLNAAAASQAFTGRIMVMGDPGTAKGDCHIEWADGGISRDFESLRLSISEIVHRHLAVRGDAAASDLKATARNGGGGEPAPAITHAVKADTAIQSKGSGESL